MKNNQTTKTQNNTREYIKLVAVISFITAASLFLIDESDRLMSYLEGFMGVFFLTFAAFKLINLKEFAQGLRDYEGLEKLPLWAGYLYPFIQIAFGLGYVLGLGSVALDSVVLVWSLYNSYVVHKTIQNKHKVHCMCFGNVIKLPLSTTSFVEDFGMAVMALSMLILR